MSANISDGSSHRSHEDLLLTETVFAKTLDRHGNTPSDRLNQRLLMADGLLKAMDLVTPAADSQRIAIVSLLFLTGRQLVAVLCIPLNWPNSFQLPGMKFATSLQSTNRGRLAPSGNHCRTMPAD